MGLHMKHYTSLINQTDWSAGAGVGVLSLSSDWKVRMTRNVALSKKLCLQIIQTSHICCVKPFRLLQTAKLQYVIMSVIYLVTGKVMSVIQSQDSVKHDALLIIMLLCAASLHICLFIV